MEDPGSQSPRLYLVGTPIGDPDDLGIRARRLLGAADLLICEDRKTASRLYRHHGIAFPRDTYLLLNEHTTPEDLSEIVAAVQKARLSVLISDAGMPVLADPGAELVRACRERGVPVSVVPGPNALTAALARAGLGNQAYFFAGFCPRKTQLRRKFLEELVPQKVPVVLYETPYRCKALLEDIYRIFPKRHRLYLAVDLTAEKEFELDCFCEEIPRFVDHVPKGPPVFVLYRS